MDEKFLEELKSVSVQDILQEQRPTTAFRIGTARGSRNLTSSHGVPGMGSSSIPEVSTTTVTSTSPTVMDSDEITTLASYRPESAAFTFSFNRPKTGRRKQESEDGSSLGNRRPPPSAFRSRGNHVSGGGMNHVRAASSTRSNTFIPEETVEFIPDLDDVNEEDLQMTVAAAPVYEIQRMASLKELDAELMQSKPFSVVDGVNLRKLCKFIVPEKLLMEEDECESLFNERCNARICYHLFQHDELWTWDSLYTEIVSSPELGEFMRLSRKDNGENDIDAITTKAP